MDGRNHFRTALKPRLKPRFVGNVRGIIIPGFLGGAGFRASTVVWPSVAVPNVWRPLAGKFNQVCEGV